jgi:hypothetical protein
MGGQAFRKGERVIGVFHSKMVCTIVFNELSQGGSGRDRIFQPCRTTDIGRQSCQLSGPFYWGRFCPRETIVPAAKPSRKAQEQLNRQVLESLRALSGDEKRKAVEMENHGH